MPRTKKPTLSDALRQATIEARDRIGSVYALAREIGIPQPMLTRFINGKTLSLRTIDRLTDKLNLQLTRRDS
jgi:plasmid maintenance system antidote protein VapI